MLKSARADNYSSILLWVGESLLGNENTIEEFTLILVSDVANLRDLSAWKGNGSITDSVENEFILDVFGEVDGATWLEDDQVSLLTTQEVFDLELFLVLGDDDIDGEMCMYESHFVSEAL